LSSLKKPDVASRMTKASDGISLLVFASAKNANEPSTHKADSASHNRKKPRLKFTISAPTTRD
jgi:hypothetical protein